MPAALEKTLPQPTASRSVTVLDVRVVRGSGGGPDKTILNSPRYFAGSRYRMLCAYLHEPGDPGFEQIRRKAAVSGAPLVSIPDRGPLDWQVVPRLVELCRREQVAVWHGHDYKSNVLGLMVRRFWPMRLVTTVHGWVHQTRRTPLYYWLDRLSLRFYEKVLCVSDDLYRICRDGGVSARSCEILENGIDTEQYRRTEDVAAAKRRMGLSPEQAVIGSAGRLSAEKGFDVLIRAVASLRERGMPVLLLIAGEGDEESRLRELIAGLDLADQVRLLGYQADLRPWYQALDAFVLGSYREGLPNVLLEALALEAPVVATRVAGIPRLIESERNGLLVPPGDAAALAQQLIRLLTESQLRAALCQRGRQTVMEQYSFARRMEKLRRLYDRLLESNP